MNFTISEQMRDKAKLKSQDMGLLNNSIRSGEGNIIGFLGEELVADYLGAKIENTYDYDLILQDTWRIDVKSKECTSTPLPNFECSIAGYNTKQKCDFYVFVRILNTLDKGWILGYMQKEEYFQKAIKYNKGDKQDDFEFHCESYNLPISQLKDIDELIS